MKAKSSSTTDLLFASTVIVCCFVIILSVLAPTKTVPALYVGIILNIVVLAVGVVQFPALRSAGIFASAFSVGYPAVEYIVNQMVPWGQYADIGPMIGATPLLVVMYWCYFVLFLGYLYSRVAMVFGRITASLSTSFAAMGASVVFENIGNALGLWANSQSGAAVLHIPLYVVLGYGVSFLLLGPLTIRPIIGGIVMSGIVGLSWIILYRII